MIESSLTARPDGAFAFVPAGTAGRQPTPSYRTDLNRRADLNVVPGHRRTAVAVAVVCLIHAYAGIGATQTTEPPAAPPTARALKISEGPTMDGRVAEDAAWLNVPPLVDFWQTAPDAGEPSSERTEVRIVYTNDTLYVGVILWDRDPSGLTVSDSRRDSPLDDTDSFRIVLDTYRDRQNGFVFATNPAGLEYDGQLTGEGSNSPFGGEVVGAGEAVDGSSQGRAEDST